ARTPPKRLDTPWMRSWISPSARSLIPWSRVSQRLPARCLAGSRFLCATQATPGRGACPAASRPQGPAGRGPGQPRRAQNTMPASLAPYLHSRSIVTSSEPASVYWNKSKRSDHPMVDRRQAEEFLARLPRDDPSRMLEEITFWLKALRDAYGVLPERAFEVVDLLDV